MVLNLYMIRNVLAQGKKLIDLPLRVTYYARVSTDHEEQLNSLENQVMYFEKHIKSQTNWIFVPGYVDEGISGTSVNKRDNFLRMIEDAKKGMFNLILTKEISRFSRNTVDSIQYTQELLSYGVGVFFLNDNINTFDSDSELRLTIMSSIAQDEIRKLSERIRFGYKRSVEKGIVPGNDNFYGYRKNQGKLEIVEEEAGLVKLIFNEYSKGEMGTARLGHYLYREYNIKSKTNKALAGTVIGRIIRNPKYKGYFCAHKETTVDYHSKKRIKFKPDEWIIYKDNEACPPIVSEELWDKCNKILDKNSVKHKTHTRTDMRYALSGKIKCYHDGATFIKGSYKNKRTGYKSKYWGCSNYRKYGKQKVDGCTTPIIHYEDILGIFKIIVSGILNRGNAIFKDIYKLVNETENKSDYSRKITELDKKISNIKSIKFELINMRVRKEIEEDEYNKAREKYSGEILWLEKQKKSYLSMNSTLDCKSSVDEFLKKMRDVILGEDESIFRVFCSILDTILVEKLDDQEVHKVMLHFKLNIAGYNNSSLNLKDFLLLFSNSDRCCGGAC
ncbi:MAG: recombinase family protein [Bacilli bacterium]|nr:recombinase family protein [Bacilli bacterium]